jgi:hypothetical protein
MDSGTDDRGTSGFERSSRAESHIQLGRRSIVLARATSASWRGDG